MRLFPSLLIVFLLSGCNLHLGKVGEPSAQGTKTQNARAKLAEVLVSPHRLAPERDVWRHPRETLEFFEVEPGQVVVELWPGGGWYTTILGPYLAESGGRLIAAGFDPDGSDYARKAMTAFTEKFVSAPHIYGQIDLAVLSKTSAPFAADNSVDRVLTFRNLHNWLGGGYLRRVFTDAFNALKPGGILGIVEHRQPEGVAPDTTGVSGYVQQSLTIDLAQQAGFVLEAHSEINANPKDSADHPFGVWTLPPVRRSAPRGSPPSPLFDSKHYDAIGESDRMTLKFRKPG